MPHYKLYWYCIVHSKTYYVEHHTINYCIDDVFNLKISDKCCSDTSTCDLVFIGYKEHTIFGNCVNDTTTNMLYD